MRSHVAAGVSRASSVLSALKLAGDSPLHTLHRVLPSACSAPSGTLVPVAGFTSTAQPCAPEVFGLCGLRNRIQGSRVSGTRDFGTRAGLLSQRSTLLPLSARGDALGRRPFSTEGVVTSADAARHVADDEEQQVASAPEAAEADASLTESQGQVEITADSTEESTAVSAEETAVESAPESAPDAAPVPETPPVEEAPRSSTVRTITSGMARHIRSGRSRRAIEVFHNAVRKGTEPDVPMYTTLIHAYAMLDKRVDAEQTYAQMVEAGLEPSERCLGVMLNMYARCKEFEKAWGLYEQIKEAGLDPAPHVYTTLISCAWVQGDRELADKFFAQARAEGKAGVVQWGVVIQHVAKSGELKEAVELLQEMVAEGVEPNAWVYTCLLQGLLQQQLDKEALAVVSFMAQNGPEPNLPVVTVLLDALKSAEGERQGLVALLLKTTQHKAYDFLVGLGNLIVDDSVHEPVSLSDVIGEEEAEDAQESRKKRAFARTVTELLHSRQLDATAVRVWEESQTLALFHGRMCIDPSLWRSERAEIDVREIKPSLSPFVAKWALLKLANQSLATGDTPVKVEFVSGWRGVTRDNEPSRSEEIVEAVTEVLDDSAIPFTPRKGALVVDGADLKTWAQGQTVLSLDELFVDSDAARENAIDVNEAAALYADSLSGPALSSAQELSEVLINAVNEE